MRYNSSDAMKTLCILGRQPAISLAELESLYGDAAITPLNQEVALLHARPDISRLGGTQKIAQLYTTIPDKPWLTIEDYLAHTLPAQLQDMPERKIHLGLSVYGMKVTPKQLQRTGLTIKKALKQAGRSVRVVPNKHPALSSAQVFHNHFTEENGAEIVIVKGSDKRLYIGKTIAVQNIDAYRLRDQQRPKRDAKVGMLPPKLAQIIINLAVGGSPVITRQSLVASHQSQVVSHQKPKTEDKRQETTQPTAVLDPFCGTGVILQEALLIGYQAHGTDIDPRMIDYARQNILDWLPKHHAVDTADTIIEVGDATSHQWTKAHPFGTIATETYLGRPFSAPPKPDVLQKVMQDVDTIHKKFLQNVAQQTESGFRLCLAVPAWHINNQIHHLKTLDSLEKLGYTRQSFVHARDNDLVYRRPDQIVGRELTVLTRQ